MTVKRCLGTLLALCSISVYAYQAGSAIDYTYRIEQGAIALSVHNQSQNNTLYVRQPLVNAEENPSHEADMALQPTALSLNPGAPVS